MGFLDTLLGKTSSDAANRAAADTYAKQQAASKGLLAAGDQYAANFDPWRATGVQANTGVQQLLADPSSVRSLPGYQFQMDEGQRALGHVQAYTGNTKSGDTIKDTLRFSQGLADQSYGNQLNRLMGVSQQGLGATGQAAGGQLGARQSAYGQDYGSAGTIGQGQIAGANAETQGIQNLLGTAAYLGGAALGGGTSFANPFKKLFSNPVSNATGGGW